MTFTKNADTSISQTGIDDTTLSNTVFQDLLDVADPISFIENTNTAIDGDSNHDTLNILYKISKLTIGGTLNIVVPHTASLYAIFNGGTQFLTNELANSGNMTWKGFVKDNDGLKESAYNLIIELARMSISNFKQAEGGMDLRGQSATFEDLILRIANPVDAYSVPTTILNLKRVWLQPIDRTYAPPDDRGVTTIPADNTFWRYRQGGIFEDVIISSPITFFSVPALITRPTILSLGGTLYFGFNGIDRSAYTDDPVYIDGISLIGDASVRSLGSPRMYLTNSEKGTNTQITSTGFNVEKQSGIEFSQDIQFEIRNTNGELLENVVIRDKETNNGKQTQFLSYCVVKSPAAYEKYDETTAINYTNTWTSDVDGRTNIINRRQGVYWWNYPENSNYNDQIATGPTLDLKTIDADNNVLFGAYAVGYKIDFNPIQIRNRGGTLVIPLVAIPVPEWKHTEAEIATFLQFDTYTTLFEGIRYWEKTHAEIVDYIGIGNSLIDFDGKTLTIADGWDLYLTDGMGEIVVNNADKSITVPTGVGLDSDEVFDNLVVRGDFVHSDVTVDGLYEYLKAGLELIKSHQLAPITSFSSAIKYVIEFFRDNNDGTQTLLNTFDAPDDVPTYFEVADGVAVTMHVHGGGIARIDDTFVELPRLIDPTPTLDGDSALIESVEAKIASGAYGVEITKNGDVLTLNLSGTESMANVNTGILYILAKHGVSDYNQGKPTGERITIAEVMADNGNNLEMFAVFGTLNSIYFNDGAATSIILNDADEGLLTSHDFGINASISTKFGGTIDVLAGDTYKIDDADYVTVTADGTISLVLNKSDTNRAWVKRDWVELSKHVLSALSPNYVPIVIKTFTEDPPVIANKYLPISDYLEAVGDGILHKKSLVVATDEAAVENQYHLRLMNDFDKTFPFGVTGLHVIRTVRDIQLILNYEPTVPTNTTNCTPTVYYENAGVSNGQNVDGSTKYEPYVVQNVGGNFESFEINIHKTTGTYNPAGAIFHNIFATTGPGNIQQFYVVRADGEKELYHAYVNSKTGNIWHMNRGLPGYEIKNGEHITFVKTPATTKTQKDLIYLAMQLAYGAMETVATGYITPLLQDSLTVTSGADIKEELGTIRANTTKVVNFQDAKLDYTEVDDEHRIVQEYDENDNLVATWNETKSGNTWTRDAVTRT